MSERQRRSLPARQIDLIRDGVSGSDRRRHGDGAVRLALGRTALSAVCRGWTQHEWEDEIRAPNSVLGQQAWTTSKGRTLTANGYARLLNQVWWAACKKEREDPALSVEQVATEQQRRAHRLQLAIEDADAPLTDTQRRVAARAAELARERPLRWVALSQHATAAATGLSVKQVRLALAALCEMGYLTLAKPGRGSAEPRQRLANLYELAPADAAIYLPGKPGLLAPAARSIGPSGKPLVGPAARSIGPPGWLSVVTLTEQQRPALDLSTLASDERELVRAALDKYRREHQQQQNEGGEAAGL